MAAMRSSPNRYRRRCAAVATGCTLIGIAISGTGCARVVAGSPRAAAPSAEVALAQLLVVPDRFPPRYPAVLLSPAEVDQSLAAIDGLALGSAVDPIGCTPPRPGPAPRDAVASVGTDAATGATITVAVTRVEDPLSTRRAQLADCPSFTTDTDGRRVEISVELLAAPPVDADDSYAVLHSVRPDAGPSLARLTLVAQLADVRISASWAESANHAGAPAETDSPDAEALDGVFLAAVLHARRNR